jgi:hypothetical protein
MNLAVSSLVIFVLLSPAILARRVFFTRELSKAFSARNTIQEIFSSIFLSGLLHAAGIAMFQSCGYEVDIELVMQLLFDPQSIADYDGITAHQADIAGYFLLVSLGAAVLSYLMRNIIRAMQWDRKWEFLRFDNTWYYLFSGEAAQIRKYQDQRTGNANYRLPNQRYVDVLTKSGDKHYLYTGNLVDYQLGSDNRLEFIVISFPLRQLIRENEAGPIARKKITSDYFVIPFTEILNVNVRYLYLEEILSKKSGEGHDKAATPSQPPSHSQTNPKAQNESPKQPSKGKSRKTR